MSALFVCYCIVVIIIVSFSVLKLFCSGLFASVANNDEHDIGKCLLL